MLTPWCPAFTRLRCHSSLLMYENGLCGHWDPGTSSSHWNTTMLNLLIYVPLTWIHAPPWLMWHQCVVHSGYGVKVSWPGEIEKQLMQPPTSLWGTQHKVYFMVHLITANRISKVFHISCSHLKKLGISPLTSVSVGLCHIVFQKILSIIFRGNTIWKREEENESGCTLIFLGVWPDIWFACSTA